MGEPDEPHCTADDLEDLVVRFSAWFTELTPSERNAAYLMTSGLANAAARETSTRTPSPGFFERYVSGANEEDVARHERAYGSYTSYATRLSPPFTPRALARLGQLLRFLEAS